MLPFVLQCQIPPYRWKLGGTWKIHLQVYEFQSCRQHHEQAGQAAQTQLHVTFYEKQRIIEQTETRHKGGVEHQRIIPGPWNLIKKLLTFAWLEFGTAVGWCFLILPFPLWGWAWLWQCSFLISTLPPLSPGFHRFETHQGLYFTGYISNVC